MKIQLGQLGRVTEDFLSLSSKFPRLFDELVQGLEAILAAGHMGVIVQLAESCAEGDERQGELMQCLLRVRLGVVLSTKPSCMPILTKSALGMRVTQ